MKTAEAAKGRWSEIFEYYGLPPITGKNHYKGECPVCKARGKYRVDDRDGQGTWICVCGSGDGMKLLTLTQSKSFSAICAEVDQLIGNNYQRINVPSNSSAARQRQRVISKFSKLLDLRGTSAAGYLLQRGISRLPAEGIRFCDRQRHAGRVYQALYALATDDKAELCYLHQTLLDGDRKADIDSAKRLKSLQGQLSGSRPLCGHSHVSGINDDRHCRRYRNSTLLLSGLWRQHLGGNQQRVYEEIPGPGRCEASDYFCRHGQALCNWTCRGVRVRPRKPAGEKRPGESQHTLAG